MKKLILLFCISLFIFESFAQGLLEKDYQVNGTSRSGIVMCNSEPIFRVIVSNPFEKYRYSSLQLIPYKDYISGFEILQMPPQMTAEAGYGFKKFNWTPLTDFKENETVYLKVKPIIVETAKDTLNIQCQSYAIELPLKRDLAPIALVEEQQLQIQINGGVVTKKYNLLGGETGENLNIFEHDDDETLEIRWIKRNQKFEPKIENGIITFKHTGPVPDDNQFEIEIKAVDHLNQESKPAKIICEIVANPDEKPVWSFNDENGEIIWREEKNEGEKIVVKPFKAINPATNESCEIEPIEPIKGSYEIKDESFIWQPSYDVIDDVWSTNNQTIKIPFVAKSNAGVKTKCTLVVKIGNSTKPNDQENYEKAVSNFSKAEKEFVELVRQPLCYIRYATELVVKKEKDIEAVQNAYTEIDAIFSVTAATNPVAVGVYKGLGLLITTLKGAGGTKATRISEKATQLNNEIAKYRTLSAQFTQKQGALKSFKTKSECDELLKLSVELVKEIEMLKTSISNYTTIGALFNKKTEQRIQSSCK